MRGARHQPERRAAAEIRRGPGRPGPRALALAAALAVLAAPALLGAPGAAAADALPPPGPLAQATPAPEREPSAEPPPAGPGWEEVLRRGRLGLDVQDLTPELRRHLGAPPDQGVLVARVAPGRPAEEAGVQVGDVLVKAGGAPLEDSLALFRRVAIVPEGERLELELVREGERQQLTVAPEGPALPDPDRVAEWLEEGVREGSRELRRTLQELERALEELERRLREPPPDAPRRT